MTKFDAIKVGDKISATYYENLVVRLKHPGEKATDTDADRRDPWNGREARRRLPRRSAPSPRPSPRSIRRCRRITFSGPHDWTYSSKVEDKKALATVKVGDKVDITWTDALLVSFAPAK